MEVILLERVEKLGAIGDVVNVKDGFARNFLLPNKKALRSNAANRKVFEANRARIEADTFIVGHRLTISPLLILISLSFWGWVWGTLGALLAVPLLIIIQTVLGAAGKPDIAGFLFEHGTLVQQKSGRNRRRGDASDDQRETGG